VRCGLLDIKIQPTLVNKFNLIKIPISEGIQKLPSQWRNCPPGREIESALSWLIKKHARAANLEQNSPAAGCSLLLRALTQRNNVRLLSALIQQNCQIELEAPLLRCQQIINANYWSV
jgi:hypothetical protein